jgi:phosphate-selective porin OprO/OprP
MDGVEILMRCDHMATERPGIQRLVLTLMVMAVSAQSVSAQQSPADFDAVVQRLEQLERDNQFLRQQVAGLHATRQPTEERTTLHQTPEVMVPANPLGRAQYADPVIYQAQSPRTIFDSTARPSLLTELEVRSIVSDTINQQADSTPTDLPTGSEDAFQNQRISELDRALQGLKSSAGRKTYPNVTVNGVFQADAGWIHQDSVSEAQYGQIRDGSDFRRARLSAKGSVTEQTNYFFQMDFGFFGRPTFTDVWLEQTNVPVFGNVRIGQWKQPFSLETVSSFRYTTFMERSVLFQPFTPFRHIGIGFYDYSDDLSATWAASAFRTGQDQFGATLSSSGGYGTAERFTCLPAWERNGKEYLHFGVGHFFNAPPGDSINFRTIPEFFVGANGPGAVGTSGQAVPGGSNGTPFFVATGNLNVPYYNVLGSELLWVDGPLSVQSETMVNLVNQSGGATAVLPGAYAQVGYFLTGEHRPYDRKAGAIDRVIPRSNLSFAGSGCSSGCGAWELAGRWSYLDLNDSAINGGTIMDYTAGINWYWNPYTKMVFNYVHAISDTPAFPTASTDMFGVRAQIDF